MPSSGSSQFTCTTCAHHQEADEEQRRGSRLRRHHVHQRGEEKAQQEADAGDDRCDARAGTLADACSGLDVGGVRGDRTEAAGDRGDRVDNQDLLRARRVALVVQHVALGADGDDRAHGVEEVTEKEGEDQQQQAEHGCGAGSRGETAEQVDPAQQAQVRHAEARQRRHVEHPAGLVHDRAGGVGAGADLQRSLHDDGEHGGAEDRDQHRALDLADEQGDQDQQADQEDRDRPARQGAADTELNRGADGLADHAGVNQADERDEEADTHGDAGAERAGYCAEDRPAEAGEDKDQDQHALPHDQAHGLRPGHLRRDGVRDHGVQAEAGRESDREAAVDAHQDGQQAGDQCGRGCHHRDRHPDVRRVGDRASR